MYVAIRLFVALGNPDTLAPSLCWGRDRAWTVLQHSDQAAMRSVQSVLVGETRYGTGGRSTHCL